MIVDYEGAVFDYLYKGKYYEVKGINTNVLLLELSLKIQKEEIEFNVLKEENDHFMMVLKKGKNQ